MASKNLIDFLNTHKFHAVINGQDLAGGFTSIKYDSEKSSITLTKAHYWGLPTLYEKITALVKNSSKKTDCVEISMFGKQVLDVDPIYEEALSTKLIKRILKFSFSGFTYVPFQTLAANGSLLTISTIFPGFDVNESGITKVNKKQRSYVENEPIALESIILNNVIYIDNFDATVDN